MGLPFAPQPSDVWREDGSRTPRQLFEELYSELRAKARIIIRGKHPADGASPTSLVHEAFLRLRRSETLNINDDCHFIALAALTMRRIIIDRAKTVRAEIHGGGFTPERLTEDQVSIKRDPEELIAIDQALDHIAERKPRAAQVGELLVFASLGVRETAALLDVSRKTVQRDIDELAAELRVLGYGNSGPTASV